MERISRAELGLVLLWCLVVVALTAVPYAIAVASAGPDRQFAGFIWGVDDGNAYISWVRQASEGQVLLSNPYTTWPQNPHFFHVFLLALGLVSRVSGLSALSVFVGSRYVCGMLCLVAFYWLMAQLAASRRVRFAALALASMSSGLGWVIVMMGQRGRLLPGLSVNPMDVADGWQAQPEALVFTSVLLNPLFSLSLALVCLIAGCFAHLPAAKGNGVAIGTGLLLLLLGNVHGYDLFALHGTLIVWLGCNVLGGRMTLRRAAQQYGIILLVSAASVVWAVYGAKADPAYAEKVNTPTLSRPPIDIALGYGIVLLLAVGGAWAALGGGSRARRRNTYLLSALLALGALGLGIQIGFGDGHLASMVTFALPVLAIVAVIGRRDLDDDRWRFLLPVVWAVCGAAVLYLPVSFQRKAIEGLHLPLCALGGVALVALIGTRGATVRWGAVSYSTRVALAAAIVLATVPSNVLFVADCMNHVSANNRTLLHVLAPPLYLSNAEVDAMGWLAGHTSQSDIVLSSSLTGSHIPTRAPCTVVAGHWAETLEFAERYAPLTLKFYAWDSAPAQREALIAISGANYVWWGPQERLLRQARGLHPEDPCTELMNLELTYDNSLVRIYRVDNVEDRPDE